METICAYYFPSLMINALTGRQLNGDFFFFHSSPFAHVCKLAAQLSVEDISYL